MVDIDEFIAAKRELDELRKQYGVGPQEGKLSRMVSSFFERRDAREKVLINRKKHIWTAVLFGWLGAHRFQTKRYVLGTVYLLLCWSGFSIAMTIIDLVEIIPIPPDENGDILI